MSRECWAACIDTMVVGFEKTEEIDDFAARVRRVPQTSDAAQGRRPRPAPVA